MIDEKLQIGSFPVKLFGNDDANVIVFLLSEKEISDDYKKITERYHTLICNILVKDWFSLLSPWEEKISGFPFFEGRGDETLSFLTKTLYPTMKKRFCFDKAVLVGYSLAGLFSLYAGTRCCCFILWTLFI